MNLSPILWIHDGYTVTIILLMTWIDFFIYIYLEDLELCILSIFPIFLSPKNHSRQYIALGAVSKIKYNIKKKYAGYLLITSVEVNTVQINKLHVDCKYV